MAAGKTDGEALLTVVEDLCAELGGAATEIGALGTGSALSAADRGLIWGALGLEEESLVLKMRARLASFAAALGGGAAEGIASRSIAVALDGAELVMRGELLRGNGARLPGLMPSFVYLVAVPLVAQDEALSLSQRTSELTKEALGR